MSPDYILNRVQLRLVGNWSKVKSLPPKLRKYHQLSLSTRHEWDPTGGLDFLDHFEHIRELWLRCYQPIDLSPLLRLKRLVYLSLETTRKRKCNFDFSPLTSLTSLRTSWNHGFVGLTRLSGLEELEIERIYKLDNLDLSGLNRLKRLSLSGGRNVKSLSLDGVRSLESLTLAGFPNLERIEHFQSGDSVLQLDVSGVKKVNPSFWRAFTLVQAVYVGPKDPITRESFGIRPKLFARWPSS